MRLALASHISASFYSNLPRWVLLMTNLTAYTSTDALWCPFHSAPTLSRTRALLVGLEKRPRRRVC